MPSVCREIVVSKHADDWGNKAADSEDGGRQDWMMGRCNSLYKYRDFSALMKAFSTSRRFRVYGTSFGLFGCRTPLHPDLSIVT
eukprot:6736843-Pyramimonas_sp.AAC.2